MKSTTPQIDYAKLYSTNSTSDSITAPAPTTTEPVANGSLGFFATGNIGDDGGMNFLHFLFFGAGADNATGAAMIYGWRKIGTLWIPQPLLGVDLVLGTSVGVAGQPVVATDRFADTISVTSGKDYTTEYEILSKSDDTIAAVKLDVIGFPYIQVLTDIGTATNLNALCAGF